MSEPKIQEIRAFINKQGFEVALADEEHGYISLVLIRKGSNS